MSQLNANTWIIIVTAVIVFTGSLIYNSISAKKLKKKRQQFVESIQSSYTHMQSIEDTSKKIYEISNEINELIREQKDTEEYIEKKKKEIEQIRQMIVTNDTILDCTISDKRDLAREKQIAFTYNIPTGLPEIPTGLVSTLKSYTWKSIRPKSIKSFMPTYLSSGMLKKPCPY